MQIVHSIFVESPIDRHDFNQRYVEYQSGRVAIARASLSVQAIRRKDVYDRKIVGRKFSTGQWVW